MFSTLSWSMLLPVHSPFSQVCFCRHWEQAGPLVKGYSETSLPLKQDIMQSKHHLRIMPSWYFREASLKKPWLASGKKNLWLAKIRKCPLHKHYDYISSLIKGRLFRTITNILFWQNKILLYIVYFSFVIGHSFTIRSRTCRANSTCKNKEIIANRIMHTLSG